MNHVVPTNTKTFRFLPGDDQSGLPASGTAFRPPGVYTEMEVVYTFGGGRAVVENMRVWFGGRPAGAPIRDLLKNRVVRASDVTVLSGIEYSLVKELIEQTRWRRQFTSTFGFNETWVDDMHLVRAIDDLVTGGSADGPGDGRFDVVVFPKARVSPILLDLDPAENRGNDLLVQSIDTSWFTPVPEAAILNLLLPQTKSRKRGLFVPGVKRTRSNARNFINVRIPHR